MASTSAPTSGAGTSTGNKHVLTALDRQRAQLSRLLKDPSKPAPVPSPPAERTVRPPREMMKNVQGSSAGAGSGEFHVYKANRRREYERLKIMEEATKKEVEKEDFERKKREREEQAEAKTSKNRAKRMKKKERAQGKTKGKTGEGDGDEAVGESPMKKRRLVNGTEIVFKPRGDDNGDDDDGDDGGDAKAAREESKQGEHIAENDEEKPVVAVADVAEKVRIYDLDS